MMEPPLPLALPVCECVCKHVHVRVYVCVCMSMSMSKCVGRDANKSNRFFDFGTVNGFATYCINHWIKQWQIKQCAAIHVRLAQ